MGAAGAAATAATAENRLAVELTAVGCGATTASFNGQILSSVLNCLFSTLCIAVQTGVTRLIKSAALPLLRRCSVNCDAECSVGDQRRGCAHFHSDRRERCDSRRCDESVAATAICTATSAVAALRRTSLFCSTTDAFYLRASARVHNV